MTSEIDHNGLAVSAPGRQPPAGSGGRAGRRTLALALLLLAGALAGCSIGITNQAPSAGGCVGEPARVYC